MNDAEHRSRQQWSAADATALTERIRAHIASRECSWGAPRPMAPEVLDRLEHASPLPLTEAQRTNIEALRRGDAVCIMTGQQPGLLLGPLFTLAKAVSAIELARKIENETGVRTVPVFWVHGEDHDIDEINQFAALGPEGSVLRSRLNLDVHSSAHVSVNGIGVMGVRALLAGWGELRSAGVDGLAEKILSAYRDGQSFSGAFAEALAHVFGARGLLVFSLPQGGTGAFAKEVFRRALVDHENITRLLEAAYGELAHSGFTNLVQIRSESPLFFVSSRNEGSSSGLELSSGARPFARYRLVRTEGVANVWSIPETGERFTTEKLLELLDKSPERFSSSALLRPVIQDSLFPTAVIIGGPAEMEYLQEAKVLYRHFGLTPPVLCPRARYIVVEPRARRLLEQLGIALSDAITTPKRDLIARGSALIPPERYAAIVHGAVTDFVSTVQSPLDASVRGVLDRLVEKVARAAQGLTDSYTKSFDSQLGTRAERISKLLAMLLPEDAPQERVLSAFPFLVRYGNPLIGLMADSYRPGEDAPVPLFIGDRL